MIQKLFIQGVIALILLSFNAYGFSEDECIRCHRIGSRESNLQIDVERYMTSLHAGKIGCADCHAVESGKEHFTGKGADDPRSSINWRNMRSTCGACHPAQTKSPEGLSILTSFHVVSHPKQDLASRFDRGMCTGCHQGQAAHGEEGVINNQNCYKCHTPLENNGMLLGTIHSYTDGPMQPIHAVAAWVSLIGLIGFILLLVRTFIDFFWQRREPSMTEGKIRC